jgi:hypothetical protein
MSSMMEQLMQLRALTIRTGAIHEAQALQLRNYPLLINGVSKATVRVDMERKLVEYSLTKCSKDFQDGFDAMENITKCVRTLLWPDSSVVFKKRGKVIYDSRA